jgi:predicted nucleic acid-binding Zn ribbon protein
VESLGHILKTTLQDLGLQIPLQRYQAIQVWAEVVGQRIADIAEPHAISGTKLIVHVKNDAWRHELLYHLPDIITKLNKRIGAAAIEEILLI